MAVEEQKVSLALSPLGLGFARAAANMLFKDFAEKGGAKPISECKNVVYPALLDLTTRVRSQEEDSRVKDKAMQGLQRELSRAKTLIAALAESQGPLAAHRAVIQGLVGLGFNSDRPDRVSSYGRGKERKLRASVTCS